MSSRQQTKGKDGLLQMETKRSMIDFLMRLDEANRKELSERRREIERLRRERSALREQVAELEQECSALIATNTALEKSDGIISFDKAELKRLRGCAAENVRLKKELEEASERLKRAEMKLNARDRADAAFKENICAGLAFLGEKVSEINVQDEKQRRREKALLGMNEKLIHKNAELQRQLGKEPGKAITIDETEKDGGGKE